MRILFLLPAEHELKKAVIYYNTQSDGLGYEFALEVQRTLQRISGYPQAWHELISGIRRCPTKRFPYSIVYTIQQKTILILAVMHMHTGPENWKNIIQRR